MAMTFETETSMRFAVSDPSGVGEVRRAAASFTSRGGFSETARENVAIVATEMASNIVKYGLQGEVVLRPIRHDDAIGVEMLALDKGPGMRDLHRCLEDGYSTGGSPGTGFGAIVRLASTFDIYSREGEGTAVLARLWGERREPPALLRTGAICIAKFGEEVSGDSWGASLDATRVVAAIADGIGHGALAAEASRAAVAVLREDPRRAPGAALEAMHGMLRGTRGAAIGVVELDLAARVARFAGVGNIAAAVLGTANIRQMVSHNGTVGHDARRIQEFVYPLPPNFRLVMHSDGLATQWRPDKYPGLWHKHPSLVAGVLYRDFTRGRDDVTILVMDEARKAGA
jgi:anti-sigma regulatory factor (Ser/Thr protein kinase)